MGNGISVNSNINLVVHKTYITKERKLPLKYKNFNELVCTKTLKDSDIHEHQALIICNSYDGTSYALGDPAKNDGVLAYQMLEELGYHCVLYHDCTRSLILKTLKKLLESNADKILVYYIGHGVTKRCTTINESNNEKYGVDSAMFMMDGEILDNELKKILDNSHKKVSKRRQIRLISDCCHSGTMYDLTEEDYINYDTVSIGACSDIQTAKQDYICRRGNGIFSYYFWKYYTNDIKLKDLLDKVNEKLQVYQQKCEASTNYANFKIL